MPVAQQTAEYGVCLRTKSKHADSLEYYANQSSGSVLYHFGADEGSPAVSGHRGSCNNSQLAFVSDASLEATPARYK